MPDNSPRSPEHEMFQAEVEHVALKEGYKESSLLVRLSTFFVYCGIATLLLLGFTHRFWLLYLAVGLMALGALIFAYESLIKSKERTRLAQSSLRHVRNALKREE